MSRIPQDPQPASQDRYELEDHPETVVIMDRHLGKPAVTYHKGVFPDATEYADLECEMMNDRLEYQRLEAQGSSMKNDRRIF